MDQWKIVARSIPSITITPSPKRRQSILHMQRQREAPNRALRSLWRFQSIEITR